MTTPLPLVFQNSYVYKNYISGGSFGKLLLISDRTREYALKCISKNGKQKSEEISNEIFAGRSLISNSVSRLHEVYEDEQNWYLVFDFLEGKNLLEYLRASIKVDETQTLSERITKIIFKQLVNTLCYCHTNEITHLDIKLENIMIEEKSKKVTLIDFGLCHYGKTNTCKRYVGSPDYCAPEILLHTPYNPEKADVFSLGVVFFALVFSRIPFSPQDRSAFANGVKNHPKIIWPSFKPVNSTIKDLIEKMLCVNPANRISMFDVANHPYFQSVNSELV
jgi:serine/threonine protein kinase